jgi:hypothetical protein
LTQTIAWKTEYDVSKATAERAIKKNALEPFRLPIYDMARALAEVPGLAALLKPYQAAEYDFDKAFAFAPNLRESLANYATVTQTTRYTATQKAGAPTE